MIRLSTLTLRELAQLDAVLTAIEDALELLLERGVVNEAQGVDLLELSEAIGAELEQRESEAA